MWLADDPNRLQCHLQPPLRDMDGIYLGGGQSRVVTRNLSGGRRMARWHNITPSPSPSPPEKVRCPKPCLILLSPPPKAVENRQQGERMDELLCEEACPTMPILLLTHKSHKQAGQASGESSRHCSSSSSADPMEKQDKQQGESSRRASL